MVVNISNKIALLASNAKVLVVGQIEQSLKDIVEKHFKNREFFDITEQSLDILNLSLYKQYDIVIISLDKKELDIFSTESPLFFEDAIYILDESCYVEFKPFINRVNTVLLKNDLQEDILLNKFFSLLAVSEVSSLLKTKEKVVNKYKDDSINDDIDTFLDQYSGNIMFINDDLNENLERLKNLEISKEVFSKVSLSLIELSNIFSKNKNLTKLSTLFFNFSEFLNYIDFESIEPKSFSAFDYLTTIIEDTTLYIDELFVYRLFKEVGVFEDSMKSNIEYFEAKLKGEPESNEDNLEFF